MKKINSLLIILTTLISMPIFAQSTGGKGALKGYKATTGIVVNGKMQSTQINETTDKPLFKTDGSVGLKANFQFEFFLGLSLNIGAFATYGASKSEYSFTDSSNTTTNVSQLDSTYKHYGVSPSLRFAPINMSFLKIYAGYGYTFSQMEIKYDKTEFESRKTTTAQLEEKDSSSLSYPFLEAGIKVMFNNTQGVEIQATQFKMKSAKFKTLGDEAINMKTNQFAVMYTMSM